MKKNREKLFLIIIMILASKLINAQTSWYSFYSGTVSLSLPNGTVGYQYARVTSPENIDPPRSGTSTSYSFSSYSYSADTKLTQITVNGYASGIGPVGTTNCYGNVNIYTNVSSTNYGTQTFNCSGTNYPVTLNASVSFTYHPRLYIVDNAIADYSIVSGLAIDIANLSYENQSNLSFKVSKYGSGTWETRPFSIFNSIGGNSGTITYDNIRGAHNDWLGYDIQIQLVQTIDGRDYTTTPKLFRLKNDLSQTITIPSTPSCSNVNTGTLTINLGSLAHTDDTGMYPFVVTLNKPTYPSCASGCVTEACFGSCILKVVRQINRESANIYDTMLNINAGEYIIKVTNGTFSMPYYKNIIIGTQDPTATIGYANSYGAYHAKSCEANGILNSTISGGSGNIYDLSEKLLGSISNNLSNIDKNYKGGIIVKDSRGCIATVTGVTSVNFNPTPAPSLSVDNTNFKNISCFNGNNGELYFTLLNSGYSSDTYTVNGASKSPALVSGNYYKITGLSYGTNGVQNLVATDGVSCSSSGSITLSQPTSALQGSNNSTFQPLCYGGDGSVTLTASNGWGGYQYKEIGGTYQSIPTIGSLKAGTHGFTISDAGGCEVNVTGIQIIDPPAITIAPHDPLSASCSTAKNGQITIDFGGGTGNKTYSVTGTSYSYTGSYTSGTSIILNNLPVGTFTVSVTDANNCSKSANFGIAGATNTVHISDFNVSQGATCNQIADGIAYINISGGDRPAKDYSLLTKTGWRTLSPGSDTANVRWLSSGTNTITIKDAGGCVYSNQYSMTLKSSHFQIAHIPYETACKQLSTGKVSVLRKPGTGANGEINFSLQDSTKKNNDGVYFYKLPVGSYWAKAIDSQGCRDSVDVAINISSSALKITNSVVRNAACTTSLTGIINVQRNNGTGIGNTSFYLLDSVKPNVDNTNFYGLPIGNYFIKATDDIGCRDSVNFDILVSNNTLRINSSYVFNNAACSTSPTGTIVASCMENENKSGWGLVKFKIGANEVSARDTVTYSKLLPDSYTITAEDSVHCSATTILTINALPNPVYFTSAVTSPQSCSEVSNGSIGIGAITSSNIKKFIYQNVTLNRKSGWNDTVFYPHLNEGSYVIIVTDTNRCSRDTVVGIENDKNNPKPYLLPFGYDSVACASATNGAIRLGVKQSMRKPDYTFYMQHNRQYVPSDSTFTGLSHVKDTIFVVDKVGCKGFDKFEVEVKKNSIQFGPLPQITHASCENAGNGKVLVFAKGGIPYSNNRYKYKISTGESFIGQTATFDSLEAKMTYTVTILDSLGCDNPMDIPIRVIDNILKLDSVIPQKTVCSEMAAGSVKFKRLYGNPGYKFILRDFTDKKIDSTMTVDSVIPFKNLYKGRYSVTVNDTNKCSASQSFYVDSVPLFSVNGIIPTRVSKYGTNGGEIRTTINEGNKQFEYKLYQLRNPLPGTAVSEGMVANTILINNLYADNYLLKIRDLANCVVDTVTKSIWFEDTVKVVQPSAALSLSIAKKTNVACYGESTGDVMLTATGGWVGYKYAINDKAYFSSNPKFSDLKKGIYLVFVQDDAKVNDSLTVYVDQPADTLSSMATTVTNKCFGDLTGSIQIETLGGTSPYVVSIDSTNWINNTAINNLPAGTYNVVVRDALNCLFRVKNVVVNQPAPISVKDYKIKNTPCLKNEGSVSVTSVKGGNGDRYTYNWSKGNSSFGKLPVISNLYSGSYHLHIEDAKECMGDTAFFVSDLSNIWVNFDTTAVNCWGKANGSATMTVVNGALPLTNVTWPGKQLSFYATSELDSGLHHVTIKDGLGCQKDTTFMIATISEITIPEVWPYRPLCLGRDDGSLQVSASGGRGGYAYDWGKYGSGDKITGLAPGTYEVTVTDANNCIKPFNFSLNYDKIEKPDLGKDLLLCSKSDYLLDPNGYLKYQWTVNNKMVSTEPVMVVKEPGTYVVNVVSDEGCLGADTVNMSFSNDQLSADFLLTTKANAGDTIMLVEISKPLPDSVVWILAPGVTLIDQGTYFKEIALPDTGTYEFSLVAYSRGCADMVKKYVQVVNQGEGSNLKSGVADLIQSVKLYPNPNSGEFSADILLSRKADVMLRIVNVGNGTTEYMNVAKGAEFYTERFSLHLTPGVYLLYIQAGGESRTVNMVVR